jgi:hypothetical protein
MPKRVPIVELEIIHPHETKKRKFVCGECQISYTLREYRILFDNRKISYFLDKNNPKVRVCHECLYDIARRMKSELGARKILVKLDLGDEEITMNF